MFKALLPSDDLSVGYFNIDFVTDSAEWPNLVARVKAICDYFLALLQRETQHYKLAK